jgi:hypothetical protein
MTEGFSGFKFRKAKSGGANEAGALGGVYASTGDPTSLSMIKQEKQPEKNISEFLGSRMFGALSPEYGARVSLIVPDSLTEKISQDKGLQDDGSNVYVRSEFFRNYSGDMYVDMDQHMPEGSKPGKLMRKDGGRPLFMGTREWLYGTLTQAFNTLNYKGFQNIAPASLLIGDFDMHTGNIGVIRDPKDPGVPPKLVRIDFAGSLDKLEDEIHPLSTSKHLPLIGPTNHYKEFPKEIRNTEQFADSLISTSTVNLEKTIDDSFNELQRHYSDKVLANWAKMSMPGRFKNSAAENITVEDIKGAMKDTMAKRQESLKEYGIQIKLTLAVSKDKETGLYKVDEQKLETLIKKHKEYFKDIIDGKKEIKLQEEDKGASEVLISKIKTVIKTLFPFMKVLPDKDSLLADRTSIVTEAIGKLGTKDDALLQQIQRTIGKHRSDDISKIAKKAAEKVQLRNSNSGRVL